MFMILVISFNLAGFLQFFSKMQGLKNNIFSDAHCLAIIVEHDPPNAFLGGLEVPFETVFTVFGKVCPRGPQTRQNHETR